MSAAQQIANFWSKVQKTDGCWLWAAAKDGHGYGQFWLGGRLIGAHRIAYEAARGPIAPGMEVDHLCRNRLCVNPSHLEEVTHRENTLRGTSPVAKYAAQTHCLRGHAFSGSNLYVEKVTGRRHCRACRSLRGRTPKNEGSQK